MSERRRGRRSLVVAALLACALGGGARAGLLDDPFDTASKLPLPVGSRLATLGLPCAAHELAGPLTALDAVRRALCDNPKTHQAWAAVEAQAAAVGIGQAAYLPSANVSANLSRVSVHDKYPDQPVLDSSFDGNSNEESINVELVLYDFGLRAANLRQERALLKAVSASQNDAILAVFLETVQAYFAAEEAQAALVAESETEHVAQQSLSVAEGKLSGGVGLEIDRLQARTAYAQASLNRIRAREAFEKALGGLAVAIGLRAGTPIALPSSEHAEPDDIATDSRIDQLMSRALQVHPKIIAAQAKLDAAKQAAAATRSAGLPSLSLTAFGDRSDTPVDRVSSRQLIESSGIGLTVRAPLFEGFGRTYKVRQAQATVEGSEADLFAAQQTVAHDVWESYVAVRGSAEAREASRTLLDNANESFTLAAGRYKAGVGNIVELLRAQSDLATARQQDVLTQTRWRLSRLQLAASLGRVDFAILRNLANPQGGADDVDAGGRGLDDAAALGK